MSYKRERQGQADHAAHESASESLLATGKRTLVEAEIGAVQRKAKGQGDAANVETASGRDPWAGLDDIQYPPGSTAEMFRDVVEGMRAADVQRRGGGNQTADDVQRAAAHGITGSSGSLPFLDQIQRSFGAHDVSNVKAHTDAAAAAGARAMGAEAYATGDHVAFAGAPSLHTAAHEAAHAVQQRAGIHLKGGVGAVGDAYEQHADAVADRVVQGKCAEDLLDAFAPSGANSSAAVQRKENADEGSGGKPSVSGAAASEVVTMDWNVDYQDTAGKTKGKMHDRYGDDQMIVKELKIDPDGKEKPRKLRGGNMAVSGDVYLGQVTVPKGSGKVTAAIQYAKKKDFTVTLDVSPKPKGAALQAATKQAQEAVMSMIEDGRGDYDAMAKEVEEDLDLASRFEGASVKVLIKPLGKSKPGELYVADGAAYNVDANSEWAALVDPTGSSTNAVTWSTSSTEDNKSGESEEDGSKVHADVDTSTKVTEAEKFITSFKESVSTNVQTMVKDIEQTIIKADNDKHTTHEKDVTWKVGMSPKDKDEKADKGKSSGGGGALGWLAKKVSSPFKWIYNKGKGLVKKIPIIGDALDIAGDIWGFIKGNVKIERDSTGKDSTTEGSNTSVQVSGAREITDMSTIATELTEQFTTETSKQVETMVSTKFGVELSKVKKKDSSSGKSMTKGGSGSTVTVETGQPKVFIKRLK